MSDVWVCAPSIRSGGGTLPKWKEAGYKVAVVRQGELLPWADYQIATDAYLGWGPSINRLIAHLLASGEKVEWFVGGADDVLPDPDHAPELIAAECGKRFLEVPYEGFPVHDTFGVMQPTGDPWHDAGGRIIERYAGSPWIGREFARRINGGKGPMWPYVHCYSDNEIQEVAMKYGVFWQRPDLCHLHAHWGRGAEAKPEWWDRTAGADYHASRPLFEQRKAAGWPGSEPIP